MIRTVDVEGIKRIEKDAVVAKLASKAGTELNPETIRADIQALYAMGYFEEIEVLSSSVSSNEIELKVVVRERPVISEIDFDGNEQLTDSDLKEVIKIKEWAILDFARVREDADRIQKHYEDKGFYLVKVKHEIAPIEGKPDEVKLTYKINDYDKVQIKKITFLNNKVFSDEQLKSIFRETKEGGFLSFLSSSGNFRESAFKQDLQMMMLWYLDHGYLKFRYENPVVTVSDDKKWLFISVYVDEGDVYQMGTVDFGGDLLFSKDELKQDLGLLEGQTFAITKRNQDIIKLTEKYQDLGYAFTNVIPKMNLRDENKTVDMVYEFEKGSLIYFNEINVLGNSKTWDKVIRRELRVNEGELYSGSRLRISRENVERLGYFQPGEVVFNTKQVPGKADQVDLEITIKERSTGTITLGAGFGSVQGFFFTTQVSEINLMGSGRTLSFSAQISALQAQRSLNLSFTEPYTFDTRWSTGFDLFYVLFPIPGFYNTRKLGLNLRTGYLLAEYTNLLVTYKNEGLKIETTATGASIDQADIDADDGVLSSVVLSIQKDKRNNRFETTDGQFWSASQEFAGIGGDKRFFKTVGNHRFYRRIWGDLVFRNSTELGGILGMGSDRVPPSERFYLGGPNNLRGFSFFSIRPAGQLGGVVEAYSLFELEYPLIRDAGLKFVTFFDTGNVWSSFPTGSAFNLRVCWGLGFRWFSPIGPLRFEWGFPLDRRAGEESSQFQFFIGPPF